MLFFFVRSSLTCAYYNACIVTKSLFHSDSTIISQVIQIYNQACKILCSFNIAMSSFGYYHVLGAKISWYLQVSW